MAHTKKCSVECQYALWMSWAFILCENKKKVFFSVEQKWMNNVSDVLNDSFIKYCTKTFSSLINSTNSNNNKKSQARMMNVQMEIQTLLLSNRKILCLHILCHSISRDLVAQKKESSNKKNAKKIMLRCEEEQIFLSCKHLVDECVYESDVECLFCVDNCCIFFVTSTFVISIKDSQKICNWKKSLT
jgi:hypothetical protein